MLKKIKSFLKPKKVGERNSRSFAGDFGVIILLVVVAVFMGLPFFYSIIQSIKPISELFIYPPRFYVVNPTFDNFSMLLKYTGKMEVPFSRYLFNSVFITAVATFFEIIVCSMAAFVFSKGKLKGKKIMFSLVVITLLFSFEATSVPSFAIMTSLKLLDTYFAIILPAIALPLGLFLLKQYIESSVPDSLIEAAHIDGAGQFTVYLKVIMPIIRPAWLTLIIFSFQQIWAREGLEYLYTESIKPLPTMFKQIISVGLGRADIAAAATVLLMIPPILVFLFSQSKIIDTMAHSGIK